MDVGEDAEKEASAFALEVVQSRGLDSDVIEVYRKDAKTGHKAPSPNPKLKVPKKKKN